MSDTTENLNTAKQGDKAPDQNKKVTLICPKHGDVTPTALFMSFKDEADATKTKQFLYCLPCLNEILLSLQKEGAIQTLEVKVEEVNPEAAGTEEKLAAPELATSDPVTEAVKKVLPFPKNE